MAVTYLLALAVFFLMVEFKLPVTNDLPLIAKYYCCTIIEVSCGLVAMCSVLRFVHRKPEQLPGWVEVRSAKVNISTCIKSVRQLEKNFCVLAGAKICVP